MSLRALLDQHGYIVLYDGVCGLCNRFVQFVLRHDRHRTMRFATLQGALGQEAVRAIPELAKVDSIVLLHRNGAFVRSTAALEVARYLGGVWLLALVGYVVPRAVRDAMYDAIARRRYRMFGRYDACPMPTPETRARFLDRSGA
ncbi:MAG: thiol-disulfide oxidoreductase DCC family protein [Gemmatimonadaceae bacterium]